SGRVQSGRAPGRSMSTRLQARRVRPRKRDDSRRVRCYRGRAQPEAPFMSSSRTPLVIGLTSLIALLSIASLAIGPAPIAPAAAVKALLSDQGAASIIVREIRLPRTLLSLLVGWIFGLTGAGLQGLLRNPLADTAVFGAPQAAAFGAVVVLYFGLVGALSFALPVAAILGALLSIALVVAVAGRHATVVVLVLSGLAVGSLAGA